MADFDFTDPAIDAYAYAQTIADELGEEAVTGYFEALVGELMELVPGLRHHFSDALLTELKEEIAQANADQASAAIRLIEGAEEKWRNDDR